MMQKRFLDSPMESYAYLEHALLGYLVLILWGPEHFIVFELFYNSVNCGKLIAVQMVLI